MDDETRAAFERMDTNFALIHVELERTNARLTAIEARQDVFETKLDAFEKRLDRLELRGSGFETKLDALHLDMRERFISTDEQFRTLTLRLQHFEVRIEDALGGVARDVMSDEMRQRLRFTGA